jgi:hypothetical protein
MEAFKEEKKEERKKESREATNQELSGMNIFVDESSSYVDDLKYWYECLEKKKDGVLMGNCCCSVC